MRIFLIILSKNNFILRKGLVRAERKNIFLVSLRLTYTYLSAKEQKVTKSLVYFKRKILPINLN